MDGTGIALNVCGTHALIEDDLARSGVVRRSDGRREPRHRRSVGGFDEHALRLVGLAVAVANLDEMIALIRRAPDPGTAREEMLVKEKELTRARDALAAMSAGALSRWY